MRNHNDLGAVSLSRDCRPSDLCCSLPCDASRARISSLEVLGKGISAMSGKPGRSGRKEFVPTEDQRHAVKVMTGLGIHEDNICLTVLNPQTNKPISKPTLRRAFRHEIATGQTELIIEVGTALVDAALGKKPSGGEPIKSDRARVDAMKFFLEFRAGWQRGMTVQHGNPTGPEGNPIPFVFKMNGTDALL